MVLLRPQPSFAIATVCNPAVASGDHRLGFGFQEWGVFCCSHFPFASSSAASSSPVHAQVQFGIVSNPVASAAVLKFT